MSTRCRIGYVDPQIGSVVYSVYCHFDGYPEGVGAILVENYASLPKLRSLLRLGDISSLGSNLDFRDENNPDGTRDYHRWRGEKIRIIVDNGISNYEANAFETGEEYAYLFVGGSWFVSETGTSWSLVEHYLYGRTDNDC